MPDDIDLHCYDALKDELTEGNLINF